ncbi:ABC transporter permease [uncultured Microbacterium sp.]|uniref:ABC transporter permease n=1 Tax=uncultured Microbacterium sp. TaxID=191216 RepID=UPI0028EFF3BB|nr:ABC transporter permease [uncultured Microbacterium sp.]
MTSPSGLHSATTVFARDLRRHLLSAGQLTLFALMAIIVFLVILAPTVVGGAGAPKIHAIASDEIVAHASASEPEWDIVRADAVPADLGADIAVIVDETAVEIHVEKASQLTGASAVAERFAVSALSVSSGVEPPAIIQSFEVDDGSAVLTRTITLVSALLTFSIITGRASWTYGALARDLSLGLFDSVLARSSPSGLLIGRIAAAVAAGIAQILVLALLAAATLAAIGERPASARVLELAVPLALWAGAGIALFVAFAIVLVLLFRSNGTASVGILMQLVGFAAFGVLMMALLDPTASWITVASLIPPVSVLLLPVRLSEGMASSVDAWIAAGAMAFVIAILLWLALRVWHAATMTDGTAATWRAILRPRTHRTSLTGAGRDDAP